MLFISSKTSNIFKVKDYGLLPFAINKSKVWSSKYSHTKQSRQTICYGCTWNCFKKIQSKNTRDNWWFNWNKIADKITRVTETSPQTNLETNEEEILRERYISSEKRQKVSGNLR